MFSIVYLILCILTGYILVMLFEGLLYKVYENKTFRLTNWFIALPLSFTLGTLFVTWYTYLLCYLFQKTNDAMKYGNILSILSISICVSIYYYIYIKSKNIRSKKLGANSIKLFLKNNKYEIWFTLITLFIWGLLMNRSLGYQNNMVMPGYSNFSDLGAHLPVIRSFSYGNNFPTQYPHFAQAGIRYHFMFYFLAGNLEYLGLNMASALNLPSTLSITSMCMLLYTLAYVLSGKRFIALLTNIFFMFRSSFAFFTFTQGFTSLSSYFNAIINNLNADGKGREHIGNTTYESWGLWSQKVFVNQRHLAFVITILIFALLLFLPLFKKTLKLKFSRALLLLSISTGLILGMSVFWNGAVIIATLCILLVMCVFSKNRLSYGITIGISLILSFIQSAFFIGTNTSPVKPEIYIGFLGVTNVSPISIDMKLIFSDLNKYIELFFNGIKSQLSFNNITQITYYITELLGVLPLLVLIYLIYTSKNKKIRLFSIIGIATTFGLILYDIPAQLSGIIKVLLWLIIIITSLIVYFSTSYDNSTTYDNTKSNRNLALNSTKSLNGRKLNINKNISMSLILAFSSPLILAFTLKLTPDITVNHKYIIISCILLNIPVAYLISQLLTHSKDALKYSKTSSKASTKAIIKKHSTASSKTRSNINSKPIWYKGYENAFVRFLGYSTKPIAYILIFLLVSTGIIDFFTLYKLDKNHVSYNNNDLTTVWVKENTSSDEIFLTDWNTHFGTPMNILMAGRKLFYGYPYFTSTAGYDIQAREIIMKSIYNPDDIDEIKLLTRANNITYVVFDSRNITGKDYPTNQTIYENNFEKVFENTEDKTTIYKISF